MNNEELGRSSSILTSELRKTFADAFLKMPSMTEQERFFIVMNGMSALVASIIDALINDDYPQKKIQMMDEFFETSKLLMEHKFKLESEMNGSEEQCY